MASQATSSRPTLGRAAFVGALLAALLATPVVACDIPAALRTSSPAGPEPVVVEAGLFFIDVFDVDDVSQVFHADVFADLRWRDDRLSEARLGFSLAGCPLTHSDIWNPEPRLVNARDFTLRGSNPVSVDSEGNVRYSQRFTGTLTARLDLREFPFDTQTLPVAVAFANAGEDVRVVAADTPRTHELGFSVAGWSVSVNEPVIEPLVLTPGLVLPQYRSTMTAERQRGYYLGKVLLPVVLIVLMAWGPYWLDPQGQPPRFGLATSSVLTLIAFKLALSLSLPRVEYLTRADLFMIGAMSLVFLTLAEVIVTSVLNDQRRELAMRMNATGRWLYPVVFALIIILTLFL